jgi:hypothetical protein
MLDRRIGRWSVVIAESIIIGFIRSTAGERLRLLLLIAFDWLLMTRKVSQDRVLTLKVM